MRVLEAPFGREMLAMTLRGTALAQIWLMALGFQCELCDDESLVRNLAVAWLSF